MSRGFDDSFPQRIRNAYYKVLDTVMERYHVLRKSDWSLLAGSQKLFAYTYDQAIDGIPIEWFVCGCPEPRFAPIDYRENKWDILKKNRLYPIIDTITRKIGKEFRLKIVHSGARSNYTTIYLVADDLAEVPLRVPTVLPDNNIANWVPVRPHERSPVRTRDRPCENKPARTIERKQSPVRGRDRKRSRESSPTRDTREVRDNSRKEPIEIKEPSPKRACVKPPNELTDLMAESARVLAELTAVTKMIAAHRAEMNSSDPKIRTEQFLASFNN
jgi:hypothetical protein